MDSLTNSHTHSTTQSINQSNDMALTFFIIIIFCGPSAATEVRATSTVPGHRRARRRERKVTLHGTIH